ncbi:hypothetical protein [Priestia megaterium]|nr:hypothetical protein [Priestia megaterium]
MDFVDGGPCTYARTFLVIDTDANDNTVTLLNVSSLNKKPYKLLYPSNKKIINYKPPFMMSSCVKLDGVYIIEYSSHLTSKLLAGGKTLSPPELRRIEAELLAYSQTNTIQDVYYDTNQFKAFNGM